MAGSGYKIVFTGRYAAGRSPLDVHKAVASLFRVEEGRVEAAFAKGRGVVVASASDMAQAERMLKGLKRAGALCAIETAPDENPPARPAPPRPAPTRHAPTPPATPDIAERMAGLEKAGAIAVRLDMGPTDITLAPLWVPRITGHARGIDINRRDRRLVEFGSLVAASAFKASEGPDRYLLMLFFDGSKRPALAQCESIAYGDFPGVKAQSMLGSLRNFLMFLSTRRMVFDEPTAAFIAGGQPGLFTKDPLLLATALYRAIPREQRPLPSKATAYGAAASEAPAPQDDAARCPKCEALFSAGRQDCPRCGFLPTRPEPALASPAPPGPEARALRLARLASAVLLISFFIPLFKATERFVLWPWEFLGIRESQAWIIQQHMARSAFLFGLWALMPLLVGGAVFALSMPVPKYPRLLRWRFHFMAVAAGLGLFALLVPLAPYFSVLKVALLPQHWKHGALLAAAVFSAFSLVHLGRAGGEYGLERLMLPASAAALVAMHVLLLLYGPSEWRSWWLAPVYAGALVLGLGGLAHASGALYGSSMPYLYKHAGLGLALCFIVLLPLASIRAAYGGFTGIGGMRMFYDFIGHAKALLIIGGAGVALQAGLWGIEMQSQGRLPRASGKPPAKTQPRSQAKALPKAPSKAPPRPPIDRQSRKS